ncbi:hypothetical protein DM02DRAFT_643318 [Periconia macrospinosa]|uniref:Uncharacterized protein n=1 Tax=Periconia macrospinosa TaxID=97972 RepID=A0A2V1DP88_9PLEO|nr:hypothetical protein DM02DRAFT_643318 [Periconia macrospinosa]
MHPVEQLTQVRLRTVSGRFRMYALEDKKHHARLADMCPAERWPENSFTRGCPRPMLVGKQHQKQLQILTEALSAAITDIVCRWWTDEQAALPKRMPLSEEEEDLLKWVEDQTVSGTMCPYNECRGSWRPDFLVDSEGNEGEIFKVTEINARFVFNGAMHLYYGQKALNESLATENNMVCGAVPAEEFLEGYLGLFNPRKPLHILKDADPGIDIHMLIHLVQQRFGHQPQIVKLADLRLLADLSSKTGFRLCRVVAEEFKSSTTFRGENNETWEEIHQLAIELLQHELFELEPEMRRQVCLRCFNDIRTVLLVHDKRMLGIVREEIPNLLRRSVLSETHAHALRTSIIPTILPGSNEISELIRMSKESPNLRDQYLLKPIRGGRGRGIIFGDQVTSQEWVSLLENMRLIDLTSGKCSVVQKRIMPCLYNLALMSPACIPYVVVGTFHVTNGKLRGLGIWRAGKERIVAISSGGYWMCSATSC